MTAQPPFDFQATLAQDGPLSRETALAALDHASALMTTADFLDAARLYQRVIGFNDVAITGAAMVGLGEALHRLDDDWQALETVGGGHAPAREPGHLPGVAQRRRGPGPRRRPPGRDRRLPRGRQAGAADDKAEIASRLGWLSKEVGDTGAAGRYFSKARGDQGFSVAIGVLAVTVIVSLTCNFGGEPGAGPLPAPARWTSSCSPRASCGGCGP